MSPTIINYHLKLSWSDGRREVMRSSLPEYLQLEIERYLQELEELRERQEDEGEAYNFSDDIDNEFITIVNIQAED
jgi:hypothetical protein